MKIRTIEKKSTDLLIHCLAFGLHVSIRIEIIGLEDLQLIRELHPALLAGGPICRLVEPRGGDQPRGHRCP